MQFKKRRIGILMGFCILVGGAWWKTCVATLDDRAKWNCPGEVLITIATNALYNVLFEKKGVHLLENTADGQQQRPVPPTLDDDGILL
jgi:hypothetical protein